MFGFSIDRVAEVVNEKKGVGAAAVISELTHLGMSGFQAAVAAAAFTASQEQVLGGDAVDVASVVVGVDSFGDCYLPVVECSVREDVSATLGLSPTCEDFALAVKDGGFDRDAARLYDCREEDGAYHLDYVGDGGNFLDLYDATFGMQRKGRCSRDVLDVSKVLGYEQPGLVVDDVQLCPVESGTVLRVQVRGTAPRIRFVIPAFGFSRGSCMFPNSGNVRVRSWWHDTRGCVVVWPGLEVVVDVPVVTGKYDFPVVLHPNSTFPIYGNTSLADMLLRTYVKTGPAGTGLHEYGASVAGLLARCGKTVADFVAKADAISASTTRFTSVRVGGAVVLDSASVCLELRGNLVVPADGSDVLTDCPFELDGSALHMGVPYRFGVSPRYSVLAYCVGSWDSPWGAHYFEPTSLDALQLAFYSDDVPRLSALVVEVNYKPEPRAGRYDEDYDSSDAEDHEREVSRQEKDEVGVVGNDVIVEFADVAFASEFVRADGMVAGTLSSVPVGCRTANRSCSFTVPGLEPYDYLVSDAIVDYWRDGVFVSGRLECFPGNVVRFRMDYDVEMLVIAAAVGKAVTGF